MKAIKSYTDLNQSKKLAEILPLESADMHYNNGSCRGVDYTEHFSAELMPYQEALYLMKIHKTNFMFQVIPCWSFVALFNLCPTINGKQPILTRGRITRFWYCYYEDEMDTQTYDNPIDACVEMILKLNELKLL